MAISNQEKAVIHVAKAKLAMHEEDYRSLLQRVAGVQSSTDLTADSFEAVMAEFERLGFRSARGRAQAARREGMATPRQIGRIRALWHAYSGGDDEAHLNRWLERQFKVSHLRFLEAYRAGKVIVVLQKMKQHTLTKRAQDSECENA